MEEESIGAVDDALLGARRNLMAEEDLPFFYWERWGGVGEKEGGGVVEGETSSTATGQQLDPGADGEEEGRGRGLVMPEEDALANCKVKIAVGRRR